MAVVAMSVLSWPWSDGGDAGGSMRMHVPGGLPALSLREDDVRRGAVKMIARSPSGLTQTLKIGADSSGQFMTNFTPNEVGQWIIIITGVCFSRSAQYSESVLKRSSVRPYVCLSHRLTAAATCGGFAAELGRRQQTSIGSC